MKAKTRIISVDQITPIIGVDMHWRGETAVPAGGMALYGFSRGRPMVLDCKQGQLAEFLKNRNLAGKKMPCFARFGFGSQSNERKWVLSNAPAIVSAGIEVCGTWRHMLGMAGPTVEIHTEGEPFEKSEFFDQLAAALLTVGTHQDESVVLVPSGETPVHWVREFCEEMGVGLTIVVRAKVNKGSWSVERFIRWYCSGRIEFRPCKAKVWVQSRHHTEQVETAHV